MPKKIRHARANATGRNETVRFVALHHYMLKCPAWETMPGTSLKILIEVWKRHNGVNNGEIVYGTREAAQVGIGKSQAAVALKDLQDRGFLKVARNSTFTLKTKEARTWILTTERYQDQPPTREFMRWVPPCEEAPKNKSRSGLPDTRSGQPDSKRSRATKLPELVRSAGPTEPEQHCLRSGLPDASIYQGGVEETDRNQPASVASEAEQLDLIAYIHGTSPTPTAASNTSPTGRLRADLDAHLRRSPPGETSRLAARIGISRPQLANFRAGRFGLNHNAAVTLRQILDGEAA